MRGMHKPDLEALDRVDGYASTSGGEPGAKGERGGVDPLLYPGTARPIRA